MLNMVDDSGLFFEWCVWLGVNQISSPGRGDRTGGRTSRCKASIRVSSCWSIWGRLGWRGDLILQTQQLSCRWGSRLWNRRRRQSAWPRCTDRRRRRRRRAKPEWQQQASCRFIINISTTQSYNHLYYTFINLRNLILRLNHCPN